VAGLGCAALAASTSRPAAFFARGRYGQHIYVVPEDDLVLVGFGTDTGYRHWPQLLSDLAGRLSLPRQGEGRRNGSPRRG
jgi:CubicO group peptidase (beta-lactamase class C family)